MPGSVEIFIRIALSAILGGIVGLEREGLKRPAGFRTHILVCIGSTLVMLSGIFLFYEYGESTTLDPARLGAQVISGIGFLGAGTIIKEGASVKGLTTAAGLWAVAGIGLAIGSGFYLGAIVTTFFILITLIVFQKLERFINRTNKERLIRINTINKPGQLGKIGTALGNLDVSIKNISLEELDDTTLSVELTIVVHRRVNKETIFENISMIDGINSIEGFNL